MAQISGACKAKATGSGANWAAGERNTRNLRDLMGFNGDLMGFYSDLMGFYSDLMGFYSDLMGYCW